MRNKKQNIPWAKPIFWGKEKEYVNKALDSTWISGGSFVNRLEDEVSDYFNCRHALSASNGTTAIHMAYLSVDLKPGDEVILPGFGFLAAANIAVQMGAKPIFAEVDPGTWCVNSYTIEKCVSKSTKLIVPVHTYGNVCPMDEIMDMARSYHIIVIEDTAEAFASRYNGKYAGCFGDIGTFSFQATKTITTGEGGMVVTNDSRLYKKMALFQSHGMLRKTFYWHELPGNNFRLTNLQAALGCAQFEKIDKIIQERGRIHHQYQYQLEDVDGISLQRFEDKCEPVLWALAVKLDPSAFPQGRDKVMKTMQEEGVETRPGFYAPINFSHFERQHLPICENISSHTISLPTYPTLTNEQIEFICQTLIRCKM